MISRSLRVAAALAVVASASLEDDAAVLSDMFGVVVTDAERSSEPRDCLGVPTFPGKCRISTSPGACYSLPGDADPSWQCWIPDQSPETETDQACKTLLSKQGACEFKDYGKPVTDKDLKSCFDIPGFKTQCSPLNDKWGACYKAGTPIWMCLNKGNPDIDSLRIDCKVTSIDDTGSEAFDGACVFGDFVQTLYKCDTVPTYNKETASTSCLGPPQSPFACFSLNPAESWQCWPGGENATNPSCITTLSASGATYDGACVNNNSPDYPNAKDAGTISTTTSTTTGPPTTTTKVTTTHDGHAIGHGLGLGAALVVMLTAAAQYAA